MNDLITDIVGYLDKKEINMEAFINKYSEKDIVDDFLIHFDKLNFKYTHFLNIIDTDSFDVDGVFSNYTIFFLNILCNCYSIIIINTA